MLNAEKYRDEILEALDCDCEGFGVTEDNKIIMCLANCNCCICQFCEKHFCNDVAKARWLLSEYKEPVKLSRLEYELLKFWNDKEFKYIARDSNDAVFVYREKPSKKSEVWGSIYEHRVLEEFYKSFLFVKWEDEEPTSIEKLLQNCVVENIREEQ